VKPLDSETHTVAVQPKNQQY